MEYPEKSNLYAFHIYVRTVYQGCKLCEYVTCLRAGLGQYNVTYFYLVLPAWMQEM
jgi:hypothetical protein